MKAYLSKWHGPFGTMTIGTTDEAVILTDWDTNPRRGRLLRRIQAAGYEIVDGANDVTARVIKALDNYSKGELKSFSLPLLQIGSPFERMVWDCLMKIPYGATITYGGLAEITGQPSAARAVAGAVGRNPLSIIVPCHRVVAANGPGGYAGGPEIKNLLLKHEKTRPM